MTTTPTSRTRPPAAPVTAPLRRVLAFELTKLASQWRVRGLLLVCLVAPAVFVAVVGHQTSLPADTVFGRWMGTTGYAGSLVVLAFGCSWGLPLIVSLVAGDVFAAEDRLGTWRHLLVAVRSPARIFWAKAAASTLVVVVLVAVLAASSLVGGLLAVGGHALVGLDGRLLPAPDALGTVLLAWVYVLAPTLAFAAVGLLGSVALGRSPMGLLLPAVLALALELAQLLPLPVACRLALPSHGFLAWRELLVSPSATAPLLVGLVVDLLWAGLALALARRMFLRRDFADLAYDGGGRRAVLAGAVPLAALLVVSALALTGLLGLHPGAGNGVTRPKLETSLGTAFGHLYRLQADQLHRPAVTEAQLDAHAACDKGGSLGEDAGPGSDWRCVVTWHLPDSGPAVGTAIYQLDVLADGRYVADGDGPKSVNGYFVVRTPTGDAPNPLWQLDGLVDLLPTTTSED